MTKSTETVSLLPCPFCGDEADFTGCRTVQCKHCGACAANARQWNARVSTNKDETIAKLREALEPFALEAEQYDYGDGSGPDLKDAPDASSLDEITDLTVGDLRRAREALTSTEKEG